MHVISVHLATTEHQLAQLTSLQQAFAVACSAVAERAFEHKCWHRVALHHIVYKEMRERFPALGSQMVCNAVYSVCRIFRALFSSQHSPLYQRHIQANNPFKLTFSSRAPVFFDRHTLSIRNNQLSLYTLEGRIKFNIDLSPDQEILFRTEKLKEVCLHYREGSYFLRFSLGDSEIDTTQTDQNILPEFVQIDDIPFSSASTPSLMAHA